MTNESQREALIVTHMPQVELLARRLHRRCPQVELDDLVQAGAIGLIQAVDRFDGTKGCLLKTLAEHRIRGALLDYLRQIDPLPRNVRRFRKQRDAVAAEFAREGKIASLDDVAVLLGISAKKCLVMSLMVLASETVSIEEVRRPLRAAG